MARGWFANCPSLYMDLSKPLVNGIHALLTFGFSQSKADYSLFTKGSGSSFVVLLVYVDDIVIIGPNLTVIDQLKHLLAFHFKLKDLGTLRYFLGLEIAHNSDGIVLSQRHYTLQLLEDTGFLLCQQCFLSLIFVPMKVIYFQMLLHIDVSLADYCI